MSVLVAAVLVVPLVLLLSIRVVWTKQIFADDVIVFKLGEERMVITRFRFRIKLEMLVIVMIDVLV